MSEEKFMFDCELCGRPYQMGPHRYDGKRIPRYDISVCGSCYKTNWDGWGPKAESPILAHLERKGLPIPPRNEKGWLPRD